MGESAIEKELRNLASSLRFGLHGHDRGVLLGLTLSCVPMQPMCALGLLISLWNLKLWRAKKLELHEGKLVYLALICSLITNVISLWIIYRAAVAIPNFGNNHATFLLAVLDIYTKAVTDAANAIGNFLSTVINSFHEGLNRKQEDFI